MHVVSWGTARRVTAVENSITRSLGTPRSTALAPFATKALWLSYQAALTSRDPGALRLAALSHPLPRRVGDHVWGMINR